jgi:integrating conjugative element
LLKSALSIKNKDRVIEILSANDDLDEEENYIKVVYKIPKDRKSEFDKIYKDFIKNL